MNNLDFVANPLLRSEFLRALNIIEQAQLTLFRETGDLSRQGLITELNDLWHSDNKPLHRSNAAAGVAVTSNLDANQAALMRTILVNAMDSFNDPFANYIQPAALERYYRRRGGQFVGIGLKFRARSNAYPVVIGPLLGGPLEHADVRPGDLIRSIDGIDQFGASSREISSSLLGRIDSTVLLRLTRDDESEDSKLLAKRQKVNLEYARGEVVADGLGYLRISRFGGRTHELVARLLQQLIQQRVNGFILDLRDNSGGSTRAARAIVSMFSDQAQIYAEQFKSGKTRRLPRQGDKLTDLPLVVLINENSMSSAEIVAGALQTAGRATLIGAPSYGKGLIQRVFDLKAPLGGAVRATIAAYATLDDVLIHGVGIVPDQYIPSAERYIFRETGSLNISESARKFKRDLLADDIQTRYPADQADRLLAQRDLQLNEAVSVLTR